MEKSTKSKRMQRFEELGLIGCLNGLGSKNMRKEHIELDLLIQKLEEHSFHLHPNEALLILAKEIKDIQDRLDEKFSKAIKE